MSADFELRCTISPDLGYIRGLLSIHGRHHGLSGERLEDLLVAVNEAVTNVLDHGGRAGLVIARAHERGITVEVLDSGGGLTAEHLKAAHVDPTGKSGFGLWVIQHLCDQVTLEQTDRGSVLSLHFHHRPDAVDSQERRTTGKSGPRRATP
ncbi:ATP-binding protein [Nonomuraea gerenzanensis]|uniref:ATP-binding region, ATPase domain protein domain protein n=1 Tax=Nonomuraea gerenzanensis TaxID=93944 RepID=A0A1M4EE83_9ACTN|nr:ATP-binding protein [Nonomuraea gerenzanensis]UBU08722.1 ATP-binding protein [Nonomuraea gerenzanensis]SBO97084.1 ATP-binding region, ATPase domain protein domain protein [Nonomuraea gerenzanensis]